MNTNIIMTIGQTIFISMLIFYLQRKQSKSDKKREEHEQARKKEAYLQLEMIMASAKLSYACAMAHKRGKANGEVEEGIEAYKKAKKEYYKLLNQNAFEHLEE